MLSLFSRTINKIRGSGDEAVTIPPMDGALRPNARVEEAKLLCALDAPDNLVFVGDHLLLSSGNAILKVDPKSGIVSAVEEFASRITSLARHPSGVLAVGLEEGRIVIRGGVHDGSALSEIRGRRIVCATAATFEDEHSLLVCLGSQKFAASDWKRDLMTKQASGSVWRVNLRTHEAICLADNLAFPYGVEVVGAGQIIVSESWRHRLLLVGSNGAIRPALVDLPGYPARIAKDASNTGFLVAMFAPRTQLVEFVLREDDYRRDMVASIDPEYWIAPSLHAPKSFLEPLQGGALKQLGELKPWAPSRSCGLVIRLDGAYRAVDSFHSRANGTRHGITSCVAVNGDVVAAAKGGNSVIVLGLRE